MTIPTFDFPMRPYPGLGETPISYASRYAAVNGFPSVAAWCNFVGLSVFDIAAGERAPLRWLASLDGGDPARFDHALAGRGDRFTLRGEILRKTDLRRLRLRVCPCCVAGDLEVLGYPEHVRPYGREFWVVAAFRSCAVHRVALTEVQAVDAMSRLGGMDFAVALRRHLPLLYEMAKTADERPPSPREIYLLSRMDGSAPDSNPILSRMPFYAVARTCEVVGSVALSGPSATVDGMDENGAHDAADRGFEILAEGPDALRDLMRKMASRVLEDPSARWGITTMLGTLHYAFSHRNDDPAFDSIREIVSEFILNTIPLGERDQVFGKEIGVRRIHSIRSASLETGVHPKTLRRHLFTHGVIPSLQPSLTDERVTFPASALRDLPDAGQRVLDLSKFSRHLGIPRAHLAIICQSDLVPAVRRPANKGAMKFAYTIDEIERFRHALLSRSIEVATPPPGVADIATTRIRCCRRVIEILRLIVADETLTKYRLEGRDDYGSLLLDVNEVKSRLVDEDHGGVPVYKVCKALGTGDRVVNRLIAHGILAVRTARNSVNRQKQRVVDTATIDEFQRLLVSLRDLAIERGVERSVLRRDLNNRGVAPAFDPKIIGIEFYLRSDLI